MPELKPNPRTDARTLIDYQRVVDALASGESWLLCIPIGLVFVIRKLLVERGLWRTTYVITQGKHHYEIPTVQEFEPVKEAIEAFLEETTIMKCDDLLSSLQAIAASIRASSCCAPGNGAGYVVDDGNIYYGTEAPLDRPTSFGGPADEFETEEEFLSHLCSAANNIVSGLILSLNGWSVLTLANLVAGGLVTAIFVANPPLGIFIALAALAFAFVTFATIASYIDTHREDWVCAIYNSDSYSNLLVRVDELVDTMVLDLDIGPFEVPLTDLIHAMISTDIINKAFTNIGLPPVIDAVDCSGCPVGCAPELWQVPIGNVTSDTIEEGVRTIVVEPIFNHTSLPSEYLVNLEKDSSDCCSMKVEIISGTWESVGGNTPYGYLVFCGSGSATALTPEVNNTEDNILDDIQVLGVYSHQNFTVRLTIPHPDA